MDEKTGREKGQHVHVQMRSAGQQRETQWRHCLWRLLPSLCML